MSKKKYVMIPFENHEKARKFLEMYPTMERESRILDFDEYPTKRYNGWTNYETWVVKLWIDNERGSYEYWREESQSVWNDATPGEYDWQTREQQATYALGERLQEQHEELAEGITGEAGVFSDLMGAALSEVNWTEIAESMMEDVDKTEAEEVSE